MTAFRYMDSYLGVAYLEVPVTGSEDDYEEFCILAWPDGELCEVLEGDTDGRPLSPDETKRIMRHPDFQDRLEQAGQNAQEAQAEEWERRLDDQANRHEDRLKEERKLGA